jgi:DnaJ like chaperone protein
MSLYTFLIMAVCGGLGYWLVSSALSYKGPPLGVDPPKPDPGTASAEQGVATRSWEAVLGVDKFATRAQVTAAYRSAIGQYHPDKVATLGPEIRALAEEKSKEINQAYERALRECVR